MQIKHNNKKTYVSTGSPQVGALRISKKDLNSQKRALCAQAGALSDTAICLKPGVFQTHQVTRGQCPCCTISTGRWLRFGSALFRSFAVDFAHEGRPNVGRAISLGRFSNVVLEMKDKHTDT